MEVIEPVLEKKEIEKTENVVEVKVDVPAKTKDAYFLVAGSFMNKINAERLVEELTEKGYASFTYYNSDNDFTYACVASLSNKSNAIQQSKELKQEGVSVWVYSVR